MPNYRIVRVNGDVSFVSANSVKEVKTACRVAGVAYTSIQREPTVTQRGNKTTIRTYKAVRG